MLKKLVLGTLGTLALSAALFAANSLGHARLHQIGGSGITGEVFIADTGTRLRVLGLASGLNPAHSYISLIYGGGSVPGGPNACEPDGTLNGPKMVVGLWDVDPDGSGTLVVSNKTGPAYTPVTTAGTISIRDITLSGALQACGEVAVNPNP